MTTRKTVLFLTHRLPFPPDKGDKIRTFHQLDHLALSHDVYCACFIDDIADRAYLGTIRRWCRDVVAIPWCRTEGLARALCGLTRREPLTRLAYEERAMREAIARWTARVNFDAVVAFSACMAPYALEAEAARRVLDLCDVDSQKWLSYSERSPWPLSRLYAREARLLREFEETCLHAFDATMVITTRERDAIDPRGRCRTLHVVPNGVTVPAQAPRPVSACGPVVGFVGAMDYRPNAEAAAWFAREAWPLIREESPGAEFRIVGRNPPRSIRRLAGGEGIVVTGRVPSATTEICRCRTLVVPLQQAWGMQNKVLEGMAWGRPVVTTPHVAETLGVGHESGLIVADEPTEFAEAVIDLCADVDRCEEVGRRARQTVLDRFRWEDALQSYERIVLGHSGERIESMGESAEMPASTLGLTKGSGARRLKAHDVCAGRLEDEPLWRVGSSGPEGSV